VDARLRNWLAAGLSGGLLLMAWLAWALVPADLHAQLPAIWIASAIVTIAVAAGPTTIERRGLADLRWPLVVAIVTPLTVLPWVALAQPPASGLALALWLLACLPLADAAAERAKRRTEARIFRVASSTLALIGTLAGVAVALGIAPIQAVAPWLVVLVAGVEAPGIAIGLSARRMDPERLGATSGDVLTGLGLVAAGLTPVVMGLVIVSPNEQLALVVTWLIGLVVASKLAVGPLARLADRSSAERDLVVSVAEAERRRLAAQLHDGPLQDLLLLLRRFELNGDEAAADRIRDIADELRDVSGELRVPVLDDLGAGAALEWLVARLERITGDEIVLERHDRERPPSAVELAVFRVAQEALANAARHGRPPVHVRYAAAADHVRLDVGDAGPGLDPEAVRMAGRGGRLGLLAMTQRAAQIGGALTVTAPDEGGTLVHFEWPARGVA
jgi:signal transduction histidine kinase